MRKSEASKIRCPRCKCYSLIKSGFTKSKYGKWQRFKCTRCKLITTKPKLKDLNKTVVIPQNSSILVIQRDEKGRFVRKEN